MNDSPLPSSSSFVREGRTAAEISAALKDRIVSGDLAGGQALRQQDLADEYGVSKIPIREALRQLEFAGLVEFRPRRGAVVVELDVQDLLDLLDVRIGLECRALELAIPNMVHADFLKAETILDAYSAATDPALWSGMNAAFHQALYEPCGRPHLLRFVRDVQARMGPIRRLAVTQASGLSRPHQEHQAILEACQRREVSVAVLCLRSHIEVTQREVAAHFRRQRR